MMLRLLICWALLGVTGLGARAATNTPSVSRPSNRYLLVIETSRAMQKRADGIAAAIRGYLSSSLNGQIYPGDTLGVWTFNDELSTGLVPLQDWPRWKDAPRLANALGEFALKLKYRGDADPKVLYPELKPLVTESDFLTVLLITSGQNAITNTPFDKEINTYYDTWKAEQAKKHQPFITILRSTAGKITHYAVAAYPWNLELPPLPEVLTNPPPKIKPVTAAPTKPKTTNILAPLIVSGKKPEPEPPPPVVPVATNPPVSPASNPAPAITVTNPAPANAPSAALPVTNPPPMPETHATTSAVPTMAQVEPPTVEPEPTAAPAKTPGHPFTWATILLIGIVVVAAGGWLVLRSRSRPKKSLITSSLDREHKL
jgi:hypothetical protein